MSTDASRYALFFTPPLDDKLWRKGCIWLGRDAETGEALPQPVPEDLVEEDIAAATAAPRLYGFHATLKPPFRLADGYTPDRLRRALGAFCRERRPFEAPPLQVQCLGDFIALRPRHPSAPLSRLAEDCVRAFDPFRAPAPAEETAKREARGLSERQHALLAEWGYPYVMDEFRFHMTLTGPLAPDARPAYELALQEYFAPQCKAGLYIDGVALFRQPEPGAPFTVDERFRFNGSALEEDDAA